MDVHIFDAVVTHEAPLSITNPLQLWWYVIINTYTYLALAFIYI